MIELLDQYPIYSGVLMIVIGLLWFGFQLYRNQSFKMKDHGLGSWKEFVNTWVLIIFLIVWGLILIIREIK